MASSPISIQSQPKKTIYSNTEIETNPQIFNMNSNLPNLFLGFIVILSKFSKALHLNQIKAFSQDQPVKLMSDIVEQQMETEAEHHSHQTWTDLESYVIMSAPTSFTKFKEPELIPARRLQKRGEFPAKTAPNYRKLMKKDVRSRSARRLHKKKVVGSNFGLSGVLTTFPFTILF